MPIRVTQTGASSRHTRIECLDGLRGLAALMVVLFHFWVGAGKPHCDVLLVGRPIDLLAPIDAMGGSRVSLFFVLSGFLLYLPFAKRMAAPDGVRDRTTLWAWLRRRFGRIAPAYYAAIPFALAPTIGTYLLNEAVRRLHHLPPRPMLSANLLDAFPACLFFAHGMVPGSEMPAFNAPLWTLTPEIQLYFAFPVLVYLIYRLNQRRGGRVEGLPIVAGTVVVASVAYRLFLYDQVGFALKSAENSLLASQYHCLANTFLGRWAEFAFGMGAAWMVVRGCIPRFRFLLPGCLLCLVLFFGVRSAWQDNPVTPPIADALGGLAFALLILSCISVPRLYRLFSARPLVAVGTVAYSLYLTHFPLMNCVHRLLKETLHVNASQGGLWVFVLNLVVCLPLALLWARLFWWFFERPSIKPARSLANEYASNRLVCGKT